MAEHLDVTEEFLKDALDAYLLKYGKCTVVDNYMAVSYTHLTLPTN